MKIALISQPLDIFIPPSMNSIGIWINEISRRMAREHEVIVYGRKGVSARKEEIGERVKTQYIFSLHHKFLSNISSRTSPYLNPKKPFFSSPLFYLEYISHIALDLRHRQVDIVHIQNFSQFVPIIRALNPNIKIVLHMRCEWLALLDYEMINHRIEKADLILGVSNAITDAVRKRFPHHAAKCRTSYTGVDIEEFKPTHREKKGRRLLFVGRVTPEKGIHVLIEAFKQVADRYPDLEVDVVGSFATLPKDRLINMSDETYIKDLTSFYSGESYLSSLKAMLPKSLRDRFHFVGHVSYEKILDYYHNADILVNPALSEPFGRSLIEANACGVPTIAPCVGGMAELIRHGENGLQVKPGDVQGLAEAIQYLLDDEERRQRMGDAGRQFVIDYFSWDRINRKLLSIYDDLLTAEQVQQEQAKKTALTPVTGRGKKQ